MKTVLVTGSQGFIGSYICNELLKHDYKVIGIDNYSKYGIINRAHDDHPNFSLRVINLTNYDAVQKITDDFDYVIACASMIGGISYFHKFAYDLMATNERIVSNTIDLSIMKKIKRIIMLSSSMVFENTDVWPTPESCLHHITPPTSSYGFQKLSCEYFVRAAKEQYGLDYTIIRPFNCIGIGEDKSIKESDVTSGNIKLTMSHVVPDLIIKILQKQNPLHILGSGEQTRCYTHGSDIARGVRMAMESDTTINADFNISSDRPTTVIELADMITKKIHGDSYEYTLEHDEPFTYDVQKRIPNVDRARLLFDFKAEVKLEDSLDEIIEYVRKQENL